MPLYVYRCDQCNIEREETHKITESPRVVCQNCGNGMEISIQPVSFKIGGSFTAATGYSKNREYEKAIEKKKESEKKGHNAIAKIGKK